MLKVPKGKDIKAQGAKGKTQRTGDKTSGFFKFLKLFPERFHFVSQPADAF